MPNIDEPTRELLSPIETQPAEGESHPGLLKGPVLFKGDEIEILGKVDGVSRQKTVPVPKREGQEQAEAKPEVHENGAAAAPAAEKETNGAESTDTDATRAEESGDIEKTELANGDAPAPTQQQTTSA